MKKSLLFLVALAAILLPVSLQAQSSRQHIRDAISKQGNCRNVAITKTGGDLMLYGRNGYASKGCPSDLLNELSELNDNDEYIDDVQLTENGSWLVLYGDNGCRWSGIPSRLEDKIREYNRNGEVVTCVAFNDYGEWVIVSTEHYSASSSDLLEWLEAGANKHGALWTVCVTNDCTVAVYENGFKKKGDVPSDLWDKLSETSIDIYRLKIAGTAWFFADKNGEYDYYM